MQAPYLIMTLADLQSGDPALAGRLMAVAMQLLPPLLGAMRARLLSGEVHWGPDAENLHRRLFFGMLVGKGFRVFRITARCTGGRTRRTCTGGCSSACWWVRVLGYLG